MRKAGSAPHSGSRAPRIALRSVAFNLLFLMIAPAAFGQADEQSRSWNQPVEPFRIAANVYYVGASDVTSFLITTPKGHILLDSGFAETVPLIERNVEKLGFRMRDIRLLLNSHAHYDHAGGLEALRTLTGAKVVAARRDAASLARGDRDDFAWGDQYAFDRVTVDRVFDHGDVIRLGDVEMEAIITPGHTRGCTTWTTTRREKGKALRFVFLGSVTVPGYDLVRLSNSTYPEIVEDYRRAFARLKKVDADVFLAAHGSFFDLEEKRAALAGRKRKGNPFVVPGEFAAFLRRSESSFERTLEQQRKQAAAK